MLKTVGISGQISLGRKHAGRHFEVREGEDGAIVLTPIRVIPESDAWLHTPEMREKLARAKQWCAENPPAETSLEQLVAFSNDPSRPR
jgi:hypothetical protein